MAFYKIKNVTNMLPKRHSKSNTTQDIVMGEKFKETTVSVLPDGEFLLETNFLPISIHKMRTEGLISVDEIDQNTYHTALNEDIKKKSQSQLIENKEVDDNFDEKSRKSAAKIVKREK